MADWLSRHWSKAKRLRRPIIASTKNLWSVANSPLVIALVSGLLIASIARSYSERDEETKEFSARSARLDASLTELQQRLSYLESADRSWDKRCNYPQASRAEWDVITGTGQYVATSPAYKGASISVVFSEAQRSSGAWDPGYDAAHWIGLFSVQPPKTALTLRGELPWLRRYVSNRIMALSVGQLPLHQGEAMTKTLAKELGTASLEEIERESDKADKQFDETMRETSTNREPSLPPCDETR